MHPGAPSRTSTKPPRRRHRVRSESDRKKHAGWRSCPRCLRSVSTNGRNFYHHMHKCDPTFFADTIAHMDASRTKLPAHSPSPPPHPALPTPHSLPLLSPTTPPRPAAAAPLTDNQRAVFTQQLCFLRIYDRTVDSVFRHLESTNAPTFTAAAFEAVRVAKTPPRPAPAASPSASTTPARTTYPYAPLPLPDTFTSPITPHHHSSSKPPTVPFSNQYPPYQHHHQHPQQQPSYVNTSNYLQPTPHHPLPSLSQAISSPYSLSPTTPPLVQDPSSTPFRYPSTSSMPPSSTTYPPTSFPPTSQLAVQSHTPPSSRQLSPPHTSVNHPKLAAPVMKPAAIKKYPSDHFQRSAQVAISVNTPTSISASVSAITPTFATNPTTLPLPSSGGHNMPAVSATIRSSVALTMTTPLYKDTLQSSTSSAQPQSNVLTSEVQTTPATSVPAAHRQSSAMSIFSVMNK